MTDMYTEQQGSKKKYLIPLVVLLLCAVSLTGAGYAYNSTVTSDGNTVVSDAIVAELYDRSTELQDGDLNFVLDWDSTRANGATTWALNEGKSTLTKTLTIKAVQTSADKGTSATLKISGLPTYYVVKVGGADVTSAATSAAGTSVTLTDGIGTFTIELKKTADVYDVVSAANATPATFNPLTHDVVSTISITATVDNGAHTH